MQAARRYQPSSDNPHPWEIFDALSRFASLGVLSPENAPLGREKSVERGLALCDAPNGDEKRATPHNMCESRCRVWSAVVSCRQLDDFGREGKGFLIATQHDEYARPNIGVVQSDYETPARRHPRPEPVQQLERCIGILFSEVVSSVNLRMKNCIIFASQPLERLCAQPLGKVGLSALERGRHTPKCMHTFA